MVFAEEYIDVGDKKLLLRSPVEEDAEILIDGLRTVCGETPYLAKDSEEITMTVEQEKEFIGRIVRSEKDLMIVGFLDGEYVGNCSLNGKSMNRFKHRSVLGIALYQKYTGQGIGRIMLERLLSVAKEKGYEQVELDVVATNERAIRLYKRLGFEICGTFPNQMKYKDGTYADAYLMVKKLK